MNIELNQSTAIYNVQDDDRQFQIHINTNYGFENPSTETLITDSEGTPVDGVEYVRIFEAYKSQFIEEVV